MGEQRRFKRPFVRLVQKHPVNPPIRLALGLGLRPPTHALLETTGRRPSLPRRNPVGNGLSDDGSTFWVVAEHGRQAGYVPQHRVEPAGAAQDRASPAHRHGACWMTTRTIGSGRSAAPSTAPWSGRWEPTC